jgi:hypothetical protein
MTSDDVVADFVSIHRAPNPTEHLLWRSLLEGSGIEVRLEATDPTGVYPDSVGSLANSELFVRAKDVDKARRLIEAAEQGQLEAKPAREGSENA